MNFAALKTFSYKENVVEVIMCQENGRTRKRSFTRAFCEIQRNISLLLLLLLFLEARVIQ